MELGDIKPDEKLIKFRKSYREQIDGWYNGSLHVAIIYSIGGLLLYYYITSLNSIVPLELIIIPITFIIISSPSFPSPLDRPCTNFPSL